MWDLWGLDPRSNGGLRLPLPLFAHGLGHSHPSLRHHTFGKMCGQSLNSRGQPIAFCGTFLDVQGLTKAVYVRQHSNGRKHPASLSLAPGRDEANKHRSRKNIEKCVR